MRPQSETRCIERSDDLWRGLVLALVLVLTIGLVTPAEAIETLAPRQPAISIENIGIIFAGGGGARARAADSHGWPFEG